MSLTSVVFPPDPYSRGEWRSAGIGGLVKQLDGIGRFLRGLRIKMRFGELTRAPIRMIRLEVCDEFVECDWLARSADPWDVDLTEGVQQRHISLQAIRDAIDVRTLLFDILPQVESASFRIYRESPNYTRELIIAGCAHRNDHSARNVHSLAMRAKILGFRFNMEGDVLRKIPAHDQTSSKERSGDQAIERSKQTLNGNSRDVSSSD
jgi:hypothetical protein